MGLLIAKLYGLYETFGGGGHPSRILMLGLDAAGKLYRSYSHHCVRCPTSVGLLTNKKAK